MKTNPNKELFWGITGEKWGKGISNVEPARGPRPRHEVAGNLNIEYRIMKSKAGDRELSELKIFRVCSELHILHNCFKRLIFVRRSRIR